MKPQVEIIIRGVRKLSKKEQKDLGNWIKSRGSLFKKENLMKLANRFSYRLYA